MIGHLSSNFASVQIAAFYKTNQILIDFDNIKIKDLITSKSKIDKIKDYQRFDNMEVF